MIAASAPQTPREIQAQHRNEMQAGQRFAKQHASAIKFTSPVIINEGSDLSCVIGPLPAFFAPHPYDCLYVFDIFAAGNGGDSRPVVAQFLQAVKAAGWSFDTPEEQTAYAEYQRDPQYMPFPMQMRLPGGPDRAELALDVIAGGRLMGGGGGYTRYQQGLVARAKAQVPPDGFLYGFQIGFTYATGQCYSCETTVDPGLRRIA